MRSQAPNSRAGLLLALLVCVAASGGAQLESQVPRSAQAEQQVRTAADPHAAIRANNLGAAYMNQQRMEQALAEFERASALDPKLIAARLNEGIALLNLQRIEPARAVLREVAERDAKNLRAWYNLGLLEKNAGEAEAALAAFAKAAALDSADADTQYFIGTLHAQLNRYPEAIAAFERAIALNKFHVSAEFGLARALQRTGEVEKARAHLQRFQHLNTEKLGAPLSLAYGDQGPYSLAETITLPPAAAPPPIPVKFTPVHPSVSGLDFLPVSFEHHIGPFGPGACLLDYDQDAKLDVLLIGRSKDKRAALYRNLGGAFEDVTEQSQLGINGEGGSCVAADYDNDGNIDIAVSLPNGVRIFRNNGKGGLMDVTDKTLIEATGSPDIRGFALAWVDLDHDGDLDLFAGRRSDSNKTGYWQNNGNGTFTFQDATFGIGQTYPITVLAGDLNQDRAIDLLLGGPEGAFALLNPREGTFKRMAIGDSSEPRLATAAANGDFDRDGWTDLVLAQLGAVSLWRNHQGTSFQEKRLPIQAAFSVVALDFDNDGWLDLAAAEWTTKQSKLYLLRNTGKGEFEDVSQSLGIRDDIHFRRVSGLFAADLDGDGDTDLLITRNGGKPLLLRNDGGNKNNWLKLSLKGLADNKSAIGTKVEVFAGASYQKFEVQSSSGYLGQNAPDLLIGLGQEKQADVVRLLWPTGVLQDEVNLAANQRHVITQIDRRGSSCPVLFAWNGSRYEFIADAIGPGIVGHWVAPGVRNTSDPTEYIKVPGSLLRPRPAPDGAGERLSFRFAEPMEEIVYLDQLRLFAVDHPADTDVNPSERFYASGPPFPSGEPVFTHRAHARPPARVTDHRGRDVTALLRERDRRYVTDFADAPYKGFAELHWIELDLGDAVGVNLRVRPTATTAPKEILSFRGSALPAGTSTQAATEESQGSPFDAHASATNQPQRSLASLGMTNKDDAVPLRLLLHGYTDYFTATSVYAAHQGGMTAIVPYVEAQLADGSWQRVVDDMGFPAGLARTMVADLTGKLPPGTRRIRIATNLKIYWDQILVDTTPVETPHRITEAPLASAQAGYLGYPREIRGTPASDIRYDYHTVSATGPYARAAGHYTRHGDVRTLVVGADDRFVIMGSGDEVAVEFDAAALPPVPAGWTRDWFFYVDGFAKDMDFYAAHPFTTTPLPYHAMPGYPYPAERKYPDRGEHLKDQLELNTRAVSGRAAPSYRYFYREHAGSSRPR
jgi:tetratricopeptide (TPR) repeat protein